MYSTHSTDFEVFQKYTKILKFLINSSDTRSYSINHLLNIVKLPNIIKKYRTFEYFIHVLHSEIFQSYTKIHKLLINSSGTFVPNKSLVKYRKITKYHQTNIELLNILHILKFCALWNTSKMHKNLQSVNSSNTFIPDYRSVLHLIRRASFYRDIVINK